VGRQGSLPVVVDVRVGGPPPGTDYKWAYFFEAVDGAAAKPPVEDIFQSMKGRGQGIFAWVVRGPGSPDLVQSSFEGGGEYS
jgi:hypothetical protein